MRKKRITLSESSQLLQDIHTHNIDLVNRTIFLHGHVGEYEDDPGTDYRSAVSFIKNLHWLESLGRSKITIKMNLEGGSWPNGMSIFDAIKVAKSKISIISYAHATSMSGIILQSASERILMPNTHFMLHYGSIGLDNTSQAASETVKFNDKECQKMLNIFSERAINGPFFKSKKWGLDKVSQFLDAEIRKRGDWYLDAAEAVYLGFADKIHS